MNAHITLLLLSVTSFVLYTTSFTTPINMSLAWLLCSRTFSATASNLWYACKIPGLVTRPEAAYRSGKRSMRSKDS